MKGNKTKYNRSSSIGFVLTLPILLWLLLFFVYPFLSTIYLGFTDQKLFGSPYQFIGLANYFKLFQDQDFLLALWRSFVWTVGSVVVELVLALGAALLLNTEFPGRNFFRIWIILPWAIPYSVIAVIARWMLSSTFGIVNILLSQLGLTNQTINFLGDANIALYTSMGVNIWKWFPFIAVTLLASLQSVDESLIDAARIDGCNVFQRFRYVLFPHMRVTISVTALLMTFWNFNTFGLIWLLTTGGPSDATTTLPVLAYKTAFQSFRMGRASSLSVIMLLLLLVFAVAYRRLSAKNENAME